MSDDVPPPEQDDSFDPRRAHSEPEGLLLAEPCPADHPGLESIRFLLDRWHAERVDKPERLPPRDAFSPETLGRLLGRISLLEPIEGGRDFRYRIHAGIAADVGGLDLGGKRVGEMPYPDYREAIIRLFAGALEAETPQLQRMRINWFGTIYDYIDVAMPLYDESRVTPVILSIMLHYDLERPTYVSRYRSASIDDEPGTFDEN